MYNALMVDVAENATTVDETLEQIVQLSLSFDQTSYGIEMNFNAPSKIFLNGKEFLLVCWVEKI